MKIKITLSLIALFMVIFGVQAFKLALADDHKNHYDHNEYCTIDLNRALKGDKNLRNAELEEADLKGADFQSADLWDADLDGADLQGADLRNANLQKADLEGANLKGAKIDGAKFRGAELEYAIWVDGRVCAEDSVGTCL